MKKYHAELKNVQGCVFDTIDSSNFVAIKKWARGRGSNTYQLILTLNVIVDGDHIEHEEYMTYTVKNGTDVVSENKYSRGYSL